MLLGVVGTCVTLLGYARHIPYTAILSSGKTFAVVIENERSRENFCGSSFFYKNVFL